VPDETESHNKRSQCCISHHDVAFYSHASHSNTFLGQRSNSKLSEIKGQATLSVWVLLSAAVLIVRGSGLLSVSVASSLLALVLFPGAFVWELIESNNGFDSAIERLAFTLAASVGINTLIMFSLGLIGHLNFMNVFVTSAILNMSIYFLSSRIHRTQTIRTRMVIKFSGLHAALLAIPAVIMVFYFFNAFAFPFTGWDAIASYNRWAIEITSTGRVGGVGSSNFSLYPLGVSLSYTWVYVLSGQIVPSAAHGVSPIFGLIALAYCFLLAKEIRSNGALAVFLTVLFPLVAVYFISGYADLPSAGFATASALYLVRNLRRASTVDVFLAGMMAALSLWMKPTGFYLVLVTPLAYLAALGAKRSGRQLVVMILGETVVLPWLLYALVSHGVSGYFADALALSSNPAFWGQQNLSLIVRLQRAAIALLTPVGAAPVVFLMFAGLVYMILSNRSIRWVAIYVASFVLIWSVFFSYDGRYLITFWPIMAAFSSAAVVKWFEFLRSRSKPAHNVLRLRRVWPQMLSCILLILAFTPVTLSAIAGAIQGPGPTISWSISHAFASDDEKLLVALGPFYDVVLFFKSNPDIYSASVVSMEPRYAGILPNATYAWPSTTNDLRGYRFFIVASWAFRMVFWNTTPLANLTRSNSPSLRLIYQVNWDRGLEGYGDGYRVFEISNS
jgi:hypothetical protein